MSTVDRKFDQLAKLRAQLKERIQETHDLSHVALDAKRDFTRGEAVKAEELLGTIEEIQRKIKQAENDEALVKAVLDLGAGGPDYPGGAWGSRKATQDSGPWAKAFEKHINQRAPSGTKALIEPVGSVAVPVFSSILPAVSDGPIDTMLQLISWESIGTDSYVFLRETLRTHLADVVAEGAKKPTSLYKVEREERQVKTIAHLSEAIPRNYLADVSLLRRYLDSVLLEGLKLALEEEVISGDGTGEHIEGLLETEGIQLQPFDVDLLTTTRQAITLLELVNISAGAYVFHPSDWERFELLQNEDGHFYLDGVIGAVPVDRTRRRLWNLPVVESLGVPEGTGILADFAGSTHGWEREDPTISWSENVYDAEAGATDFERNQIRFRAEQRTGFSVLRAAGIVEIELFEGS